MTGPKLTGAAADIAALDAVREAHVAALNAGDAAGWAAQFAEDGVQMPPNAPANAGREAIAAWSGGFLGMFEVRFGLDLDEVRVLDDWALERGAYSIALVPRGGGPEMSDKGKYITLYRRTPAGWRMARDIWNSDLPPPA